MRLANPKRELGSPVPWAVLAVKIGENRHLIKWEYHQKAEEVKQGRYLLGEGARRMRPNHASSLFAHPPIFIGSFAVLPTYRRGSPLIGSQRLANPCWDEI